MSLLLKNQNLSSKFLIVVFSIACYWFYLSICLGYFLSKVFYNFYKFFEKIYKPDPSKITKFRKKFSLKAIKEYVISYILKFFKDWIKRIGDKFPLVLNSIEKCIKLLEFYREKFKSIFKFKYDFPMLKTLFHIFFSFLKQLNR